MPTFPPQIHPPARVIAFGLFIKDAENESLIRWNRRKYSLSPLKTTAFRKDFPEFLCPKQNLPLMKIAPSVSCILISAHKKRCLIRLKTISPR